MNYNKWWNDQVADVVSDINVWWGAESSAPSSWIHWIRDEIIGDIMNVVEEGPSSPDGYRGQEFLSLHPFQGVFDKWQGLLWDPDYFNGADEDAPDAPWSDPDWIDLGRCLQRLPGAIPAWFETVWFQTKERDPLFVDHNCSRSRRGCSWVRRRRGDGHRAQHVVA